MSTYNSHLPAGLIDNNSEIFGDGFGNTYQLIGSNVVAFDLFDDGLINALESAMLADVSVHLAVVALSGRQGRSSELKQYAYCCYGGFDNKPDFFDGKLSAPEYWPCPKRGNCQFEGKICALYTATGETLTKREIEYTALTAQGYLDKEIAVIMEISEYTVTTHSKNIRAKTGLSRKADLTRFAIENNLLKSGQSFLNDPESV